MENVTPRISVEGLCKSFAAPVLQDVRLEIADGSIHGIVGENGAGKSTLINIICGLLTADAGAIKLEGQDYAPESRKESINQGVALASQELSLIDTLSVAENIMLTVLPRKAITIDRNGVEQKARELMNMVALDSATLHKRVADLSLAQKQLVELAKALSMANEQARLLILDEPTSALTSTQADELHKIIRKKAENGLSVIYVSHRLDDVLEVCDVVSVLRDGEIQLTAPASTLDSDALIKAMSGEKLQSRGEQKIREYGDVRLDVFQLTTAELPNAISLQCHEGEVLGIAGLSGSGRSELLHGIFGLGVEQRGRVTLLGKEKNDIHIDSATTAVKHGVALIAEDRKTQGIFASKTISLNTTVAGLGKFGSSLSRVVPAREMQVSEELIDRLKVKCEGPLQLIDRLSGGNQQKVLIARWLETKANFWLLDEPTRGVDVGSKAAIHEHLRQLRDQGAVIVIASSELEELTTLCDRILVLSNRKAVKTFKRGEWNRELLLEAAFSQHKGERLAS